MAHLIKTHSESLLNLPNNSVNITLVTIVNGSLFCAKAQNTKMKHQAHIRPRLEKQNNRSVHL